MTIDDVLAWKELGIGAVAMIVFYKFATTVTNNATAQMYQLHIDFLQAYKENTKALSELVVAFKDHIRCKDEAIKLLEEKYRRES